MSGPFDETYEAFGVRYVLTSRPRLGYWLRRESDGASLGFFGTRGYAVHAARLDAQRCQCPPCPGRGHDGHGMAHRAECCFGTGVDGQPPPGCPVHNFNESAS